MNDFRNYKPENNGTKDAPPSASDLNGTLELAKNVSKLMNGKNETQLLHTIIAEAERGKREGRLTNADIDNFYNTVSPMLDGFKRKKLKEVITRLKNI